MPATPSANLAQNATILVVEEDDGVRLLLNDALPRWGFRVLSASNGRDALEVYRQSDEQIDLVLMDVNMRGQDGPQTLATMHEINPQVRCCFMTGDTSASRWQELLAIGALCVIEKPFTSLRDLSQTLTKYLPRTS